MVGFPLLLIPLAICNIIVFLMPGVAFDATLLTVPLWSGAAWKISLGDVLLALGIFLLLLEIVRGARPGGKYVTDHLLALLVFGGAAAEFVLLPQFATSIFFLLTLLAGVDFLGGLALRRRNPPRRAVRAEPVTPVATSVREQPAADLRNDPAPAATVPAAASVAEAVLQDRAAPVQDAGASAPEPSPQIASPDLQPVHDPHSPEKPR